MGEVVGRNSENDKGSVSLLTIFGLMFLVGFWGLFQLVGLLPGLGGGISIMLCLIYLLVLVGNILSVWGAGRRNGWVLW